MDWPFTTFVEYPPRLIIGYAEIVGTGSGSCDVGTIYVRHKSGHRMASYWERKAVETKLYDPKQFIAIERKYVASTREPRHEQC